MKSVCPHTWVADLEPGGNDTTRLFPESATNTMPLAGSTFTSRGFESVFGEALGEAFAFAAVDEKSGCPSTLLAAPPAFVAGKIKTRLSAGDATYRFPAASTASPAGAAMVEAEGCPITPLV